MAAEHLARENSMNVRAASKQESDAPRVFSFFKILFEISERCN